MSYYNSYLISFLLKSYCKSVLTNTDDHKNVFLPKVAALLLSCCIPGPVPVYKYLCIWWATAVVYQLQVSWATCIFLSHGISELLSCQTGSLVKWKVREILKLKCFIIPGYSLFSKPSLFRLCAVNIYYFC